jgi:hypothetical protein
MTAVLHSYHVTRYNGFSRRTDLACPFFVPAEILNDGSWQHPDRLPLGAGWRGSCCSSGDNFVPDEATLRELCNLGYAHACSRLSKDRDWDAIRFSVARASAEQITLWYVCESAHAPCEHGHLMHDRARQSWMNPHPDPRVQKLADSYLRAYQLRQSNPSEEQSIP